MKRLAMATAGGLLFGILAACSSNVDDPNPGDSPDCASFDDEAEEQSVTVTVRNDTTGPLFWSNDIGCVSFLSLQVTDPDGNARTWRAGGLCQFTCEILQQEGPDCPAMCPLPPVIYIEPGGSYDEEWTGLVHEERSMPEACYLSPLQPGDQPCQQLVVAPAGDYTMTARAWTELSDCAGGSCLCQPDASGSCAVDTMGTITGAAVEASASVNYPDEATVEIVFQ